MPREADVLEMDRVEFEETGELRAEDVEEKLRRLVEGNSFHSGTSWLGNAEIVAFYAPSLPDTKGVTTYADVRTVGKRERQQHECEWTFVIRLNWDEWRALDDTQRLAVLDHQLYHCYLLKCDREKPKLRGHTLEEFLPVLRDYGLCFPGYKAHARAIQPHLPGLAIEDGEKALAEGMAIIDRIDADGQTDISFAPEAVRAVADAVEPLRQVADESGATITITDVHSGRTATITPREAAEKITARVG